MSVQSTAKPGLGIWMLTALVAGNMIGSGVFLLPASLAIFGSISILAWIFTAGGALILALLFARLAAHLPRAGGPYAYSREAFGDFMGFQVSYNYWIGLWVGNAAIVTAFVSYLSVFFPILAHNAMVSFLVSVGTVWGLTAINIYGIRTAGGVQLVTTVLKILPLVLIAVFGLSHINIDNLKEFNISGQSDLSAFSGAAALTLWAFLGVESATIPAGSVDKPKRDIPRATMYGTLIAAIVYITSNIAVMGLLPMQALSQSQAPYADAATVIFGHWGTVLVALGAMVSSFGALNGWILLQGQIPKAVADDGLFPKSFKRETKQGTPYFALLVSAMLITILLVLTLNKSLVDKFTFIIRLATFAELIPYLLCSMGKILLHLKYPDEFKDKSLWPTVLLAVLAFSYSFWAVIGAGSNIVFYGALLIFSGIPLYVWIKASHWQPTTAHEASLG